MQKRDFLLEQGNPSPTAKKWDKSVTQVPPQLATLSLEPDHLPTPLRNPMPSDHFGNAFGKFSMKCIYLHIPEILLS